MDRWKHQGATSDKWQYKHKVICLYSGNEGYVFSEFKKLTEEQENKLTMQWMRKHCRCEHCIEDREHRTKVIKRLKENNDTNALKAMGII